MVHIYAFRCTLKGIPGFPWIPMDSHGMPWLGTTSCKSWFQPKMPSKAPRATWPFSGWPNLTMAGKIMENLPNWRFQLEVWRIHGIWSPLACLMRLFALGRRWFCFFGSKMIRWFWSCLVKTCCLWSKDLPSCAGKYPAPQLGALQFFANGPLLQLRNWVPWWKIFRLFRLLQKPGMTWTLTMTPW